MTDCLTRLQPIADYIFEKAGRLGSSELNSAEWNFFLVWSFGGIVDNGGLPAFYVESTGDFSASTVIALREVGCIELADILEKANSVFGQDGPPLDFEQRNNLVLGLDEDQIERLDILETKYFESAEDQDAILERYVDCHPSEFGSTLN